MTRNKFIKIIFAFLLFTSFLSTPIATAQFEPILTITPEQDGQPVNTISISSDGRWFLTGTYRPILWDSQTGEMIRIFHGHDELSLNLIVPVIITGSTFSNDNRILATGDDGFNAVVSDVNTGDALIKVKSYSTDPTGGGMKGLAFTPDGRKLLTGASNGALQLWDVRTGEELKRYINRGVILSLFLLPDGNRAVIWFTGVIVIFDINQDLYND